MAPVLVRASRSELVFSVRLVKECMVDVLALSLSLSLLAAALTATHPLLFSLQRPPLGSCRSAGNRLWGRHRGRRRCSARRAGGCRAVETREGRRGRDGVGDSHWHWQWHSCACLSYFIIIGVNIARTSTRHYHGALSHFQPHPVLVLLFRSPSHVHSLHRWHDQIKRRSLNFIPFEIRGHSISSVSKRLRGHHCDARQPALLPLLLLLLLSFVDRVGRDLARSDMGRRTKARSDHHAPKSHPRSACRTSRDLLSDVL